MVLPDLYVYVSLLLTDLYVVCMYCTVGRTLQGDHVQGLCERI
jgi:hypothetical protein